MAQRSGRFVLVRDAISVFVQMGCELRSLPGGMIGSSGERISVRFLLNPETAGFVELIDLDDDEQVTIDEIEYWERRLAMD
ncbi:MAG: hypothetical protein ACRC7C_17565, partial [Beijerinckiaceae bacterium]